jgi:hypothetical protein
MKLRSLEKAAKLPQTTATWQATVRLAPAWVEQKDRPRYRPHLVLVLDAESGAIRMLMMEEQRPAAEAILSLLANAISKPMMGAGGRYRPARVLIDDEELARALAPQLAEIGVGCDYATSLPALEAVLRELSAQLNQGEARPGLLEAPGVTLPLLAEFYAAAAYFYQQASWRWVDNLAAIEVRYPATGPVRYAAIMGFGGQEFGLAVFPTMKDLRLQYSHLEPDRLMQKMTALSVTYGESDALPFDDLDAITEHDWPIAGPNCYPLVMKTIPPGELVSPSKEELALLAAALRTLPDFVAQHRSSEGAALRAAEDVFALPNVHANQQIAYRCPVDLPELAALREQAAVSDAEIEKMIEDWYWDDESHAFARQIGALLLEFLDYLEWTGLSEQTLRKHEQNCWLIGKFTCDYGGFKTYTPAILQGGPRYLGEFRRKVSSSANAVNSYQVTWRKLGRFLREQDYV